MSLPLSGKTVIMSGGSRGIGLAIALRAARDGANIAFIAKTSEPRPDLPGTVYSAAAEIERVGGHALPVAGDIRDDETVLGAVECAVAQFGGIDICVNNASAIDLSQTTTISMKRYDLMQDVNTRGPFLLSRACVAHLAASDNPHILTLSPPLNLDPRWMGAHLGYTIAKYGMSLCTIGLAEELRAKRIAANSLWPAAMVDTVAVTRLLGADRAARTRSPNVMADAAYLIVTSASSEFSGELLLDEEVLRRFGVTNLSQYRRCAREEDLERDLFVDPAPTRA
jgi:citronellol/citronellal dehydrogenase